MNRSGRALQHNWTLPVRFLLTYSLPKVKRKPFDDRLLSDADVNYTELADAREQTAREPEEIEKLRRDLSEYYSRIAELEKQLEAQSKDLETSNSFFNTADKSSDSDVIRALQRLNAEVQQDTTYMADCLAEDFEFENLTTDSPGERASAAQRASYRLGSILMNSLGTSTPEDIPLLLQIAFQAYFASVLSQAVSSWAYEPGSNTFIWKIYKKLRNVGEESNSACLPCSS